MLEVFDKQNSLIGYIKPFSPDIDLKSEDLAKYVKWRNENKNAFFTQIEVNEEQTKNWLESTFTNQENKILFFVYNKTKQKIGYTAVLNIKNNENAEIANVLKGEKLSEPGLMQSATLKIIDTIKKQFNISKLYLEVFSDNQKAISLYKKLGFIESSSTPLKKEKLDNGIKWIKASDKKLESEKHCITMELTI